MINKITTADASKKFVNIISGPKHNRSEQVIDGIVLFIYKYILSAQII